jgi:hypothetical protein
MKLIMMVTPERLTIPMVKSRNSSLAMIATLITPPVMIKQGQ